MSVFSCLDFLSAQIWTPTLFSASGALTCIPFLSGQSVLNGMATIRHFNISTLVVQLLSCVRLFVTPWTAAHQASLSFTIARSLLKLMSIELVMP